MCISNNAIEQQAYIMSEKIRKNSIYKPIRMECIGGKSIELQKTPLEDSWTDKDLPLICKVILEDGEGMRFAIEPTRIGLRYAKGEITYKEYKQLQNKESKQFIGYIMALSSGFLIISWGVLRLFFM